MLQMTPSRHCVMEHPTCNREFVGSSLTRGCYSRVFTFTDKITIFCGVTSQALWKCFACLSACDATMVKKIAWWRHQMDKFSALLALCAGIHRSPVNSPHKGQWRGALIFSLICGLNKRLSEQSWGWWFKMTSCSLWRHCKDISWEVIISSFSLFVSSEAVISSFQTLNPKV